MVIITKRQSCGVAVLDSLSEIIPIALHYLGLPSNSQNPQNYRKAQALLLEFPELARAEEKSRFLLPL